MYDLANQSFTLLILTLFFSLFFKQVIVAAPLIERGALDAGFSPAIAQAAAAADATVLDTLDAADRATLADIAARAGASGDRLYSIIVGVSLLLVVATSPVLGAIADARQWRKELLLGTGLVCVALTCAFAALGPGAVLLGALLFIPANYCYQTGENLLASFLPDVSTPRNIGRVSATGWTMGYVGALALLVCVLLIAKLFHLDTTGQWRPFFVFAGLWFLVGMVPSLLFIHEHKRPVQRHTALLVEGFARVAQTLAHARHYRQLLRFLIAFFIYGFGVQTVINFASIIAADFGIEGRFLIVFVLQLTVTAGIAAVLTGRFQDRIGARTTVLVYLAVWVASTLALVAISLLPSKPQWVFWVVGNGIGIGLGGIGTASRSMVGRFTPRHRSAEFFGLWGLSYKLAGAIGVLSFGLVKAGLGNVNALVLLASFFAVGFVVTLTVRETAGVRAARRAERDNDKSTAAPLPRTPLTPISPTE
jgi:UMF1 family MFS transporter